MTAHYLKHPNLASNLQPPVGEDDLISALILHDPINVQKKKKHDRL